MDKIRIDNEDEKLTAVEIGKLWAAYLGNSMARCVLTHFLAHVDDADIKKALQHGHKLSDRFAAIIKDIFVRENYPVPVGFTEQDVNPEAPRLFEDEFYLHYLRYTAKAGISLYGTAVPILARSDVRKLFTECLLESIEMVNAVNNVLIDKGLIAKPPYIPTPEHVRFVNKHSYQDGLFGQERPLQALEITHLFDIVENNATSKGVLIAFHQTAKDEESKRFFRKGVEISTRHYDGCSEVLGHENLPAPPVLDHLVTTSAVPAFSDKLMVFHKLDMFSMRIRTYGDAISLCARRDLVAKYGKFMLEVGGYAELGARIMIEHEWMEEPPMAADRRVMHAK